MQNGEWAVVTGASSGLGAEFARQLAKRGYNLVLIARRRERLEQLAKLFEYELRVRSIVLACDLSEPRAITEILRTLEQENIAPSLLVNSAGFGAQGAVVGLPLERTIAMIKLNVLALTELSLTLGARMAEKKVGAILNVASTAAFQPTPYFAVYAATKAYVLSFTEALAYELRPLGVRVLAFCPGPVDTEFFEAGNVDAKPHPLLVMTAERCVRIALRALGRGRSRKVAGWLNALGAWLASVVPRAWAIAFAARMMKPKTTSLKPK